MKIYYITNTGYYGGEGEADICPDYATTLAPDIKEGCITKWNGISWEYVEDTRAKTLFTLSRKEELKRERAGIEAWLKGHDYIGVKIATGRASIAEYAAVIAEMAEKANRINDIDTELAAL